MTDQKRQTDCSRGAGPWPPGLVGHVHQDFESLLQKLQAETDEDKSQEFCKSLVQFLGMQVHFSKIWGSWIETCKPKAKTTYRVDAPKPYFPLSNLTYLKYRKSDFQRFLHIICMHTYTWNFIYTSTYLMYRMFIWRYIICQNVWHALILNTCLKYASHISYVARCNSTHIDMLWWFLSRQLERGSCSSLASGKRWVPKLSWKPSWKRTTCKLRHGWSRDWAEIMIWSIWITVRVQI